MKIALRILCAAFASFVVEIFSIREDAMVYGDLTNLADVKPARRAGETRHRAARTKVAGCAALHPPYDRTAETRNGAAQPRNKKQRSTAEYAVASRRTRRRHSG
jgi:hypothetical protein